MTVSSFDILCDNNKVPMESSCPAVSSKGGNTCRFVKINIATDRSLSSTASKRTNKSKKYTVSPYLPSDRVQLLSRVTEKRMVHKKTTDIVSSFPLAFNIYKASSDEFKSPKKVKKVKKSVLTLPNDPAPTPQICTVSDMNDSEYCEKISQDRKQKVIKKRNPNQNNRKIRVRQKDLEFYDRDARFCSQLNIDLDCSSTDMLKNFNGDGTKVFSKKKTTFNKPQLDAPGNLSDVWTVLRNINKFQFRPSPPASEESTTPMKKKSQKRRPSRKDARVIETCHTEEFAYISSYEVDDKSHRTFSPSSSADRITVIDKQSEFSKICKEFEKRLTHDFVKDNSNTGNPKIKRRLRSPRKNMKALTNIGAKEHKPTLKKKKKKAKRPVDEQSKSAPTNSSGNRDSLLDAETLKIYCNSDVSSNNAKFNDSTCRIDGSFVYSDYSGSSKAELSQKQDKLENFEKTIAISSSLLNGSTPVAANKDQFLIASSIAPKQCDLPKRKPRLVTTMPSSNIMPKLTQTEIKRRLANIRFPIVILGKDQVSSGIKVMDHDPPQFGGLEDHIWPFMVDWSTTTTKDATHQDVTVDKKNVSVVSDTNSIKSCQASIEMITRNRSPEIYKEKKRIIIETASTNKGKIEVKKPPSPDISDKILQCSKKQKSIVQLKDKMLNFLYKKTSNRTINPKTDQNAQSKPKCPVITENQFVATEIQLRPTNPSVLNEVTKKKYFPSSIPTVGRNRKPQNYTYPWAKAKWASDFIENVIKKIRNGVYYNQELKDFSQIFPMDFKEVSVQVGSSCDSSDFTQTFDGDTDPLQDLIEPLGIPGFNQTLPVLEVKTLNVNQITVKHRVTNVMIQFDVTVPAKKTRRASSFTKALPLIPLEVTNSHTKVYKCKTTIFNGMLPAEICSILPKIMNNIIHSTNKNISTDRTFPICATKNESCLSTITEQTRFENAESLSLKLLNSSLISKLRIVKGCFPNKLHIKPIVQKYVLQIEYHNCSVADLLPQVSLDDLLQYEVGPLAVELDTCKYAHSQLPSNKPQEVLSVTDVVPSTCTTLAIYTGNSSSTDKITAVPWCYDLTDTMKNLLCNYNLQIQFNLSSYFETVKLQYDGQNVKLNLLITNYNSVQKNVAVTVSNVKIASLFKAFLKSNVNKRVRSKAPLKCIEYVNTALANRTKSTEVNQVTFNKFKRKGLHRLYRKCKSTTNLPLSGDKNPNTPLNKITTMDEFFQVLGSKKLLSSVFDGYSSEKILTSIMEMKNWITEINAKQALLILLLTNKKDTPNLVRFRPIILQGIAVNRITRATELDMEIEVIERENLNKFSQFEGISYLPASVTNYDNLLEELYWIAKTTASDYQRPFDESSERLLKSLLEKRKKLNPSYLRVMARYVGLGLLKPPAKC